jgi:cytochrome c-type biogenesis protein CcmH/NrfG
MLTLSLERDHREAGNLPFSLATVDDVRKMPDGHDVDAMLDNIREALLEDPQEAATILGNIKMLLQHFDDAERKAA